ncbi:MAG TPA: hypothetical protein VFV84_15915 [Burkholderiales bacterium]|nr:hypothetical protein [Burkholderiales bacterium]
MKLAAVLEQALAGEESLFRAQLLREDLARLAKLEALAATAADAEAFVKAGMRVGWTPGDARTGELREALGPFLRALYAGDDAATLDAWEALHRVRMERLLGCLTTPVPRPED